MQRTIWIGYDPREQDAYDVCVASIANHAREPIPVFPIRMDAMRRRGIYWREHEYRAGRMWDIASDAPMSTEFAITRFLTPRLAGGGWALFMDCDMLIRADLAELFALADPAKAVQVVKHQHRPTEALKMDGQIQTAYPRKNWSSVMLWNCEHPANRKLDLFYINRMPGRVLHGFEWLCEDDIGELPKAFNHLIGVEPPRPDAKIAHFTLGIPSMAGYEDCEFADEWRATIPRYCRYG